jgi:hypothetical protein
MPLSQIKTNSIAAGNITSALITSVANTAIVGRIATAQQPTGAVLQAVLGTAVGVTASQATYPNSSTRATVNSLSITPISSSSKVYVTYSGWWYPYDGSPSDNNQVGQTGAIYRNSTVITAAGVWQIQVSAGNTYTYYGMQSFVALDSPGTTSAITYSLQVYGWAGNLSTVTLRETGGILVAMEIAG